MEMPPPTPPDDDDDDSLGMVPPANSLAPPVPLPNPDNAAATIAALLRASATGDKDDATPRLDA